MKQNPIYKRYYYKNTPRYITNLARKLRNNITECEKILWEKLSNKKFNELRFRRQHPRGRYIADFYNHEKRLIIEIDGNIHNMQKEYDKNRDEFLQAAGYNIIRIDNNEIIQDIDNVLEKIEQKIDNFQLK